MSLSDFTDVSAERAVHAGVFRFGYDAYIDCDELLESQSFSEDIGQNLWACISDHYKDGDQGPFDIPSLKSAAKRIGLADVFTDSDNLRYVRAVKNYDVELETVRKEATKIYKLNIGRELDQHLADCRRNLHKITGDESLNQILAIAENPIFDFTAKLQGERTGPIQIADGSDAWLENILNNPPCETIGIPSPFALYNELIGGGFRRKSISMLAARPKTGKTVFCDNICLHVAGELGIPVLNIDTEMTQEEHLARILGHITNIDSLKIEMGQLTVGQADELRHANEWLKQIPYYYEAVVDRSFEEQIASMRRWVIKNVGVNNEGRRNDALIVYDYLQVSDQSEFKGNHFQTHEIFGFHLMGLMRMAARCDVSVFSTLQMTREGIDKETTAVVSGGDKSVHKCGNLSLLKRKDLKEIAEFPDAGNLKLINLISRHGPGGLDGDYINIDFNGATSRMVEGQTRYELERQTGRKTVGFEVEKDDAEYEFGDPESIL